MKIFICDYCDKKIFDEPHGYMGDYHKECWEEAKPDSNGRPKMDNGLARTNELLAEISTSLQEIATMMMKKDG